MGATPGNGFVWVAWACGRDVSGASSAHVKMDRIKTYTALSLSTGMALMTPFVVPDLQFLWESWWWPSTACSMGVISAIGVRWIQRASERSPLQFVAAVNGTTAMKLFAALGWLTAYLVTHQEHRVEYVFSTFGVFVLDTAILVVSTTRSSSQMEKN
jgi:hypothetical protein